MNKLKVVIVFLAGIVVIACNQSKKENNEQSTNKELKDDVMKVHDEVMGKMSKIMQLKMQLADSLATKDSTAATFKNYQSECYKLKSLLEKDNTEMMNWMAQYNEDTLGVLGMEDGKAYLISQKKQIEDLKNSTYEHLDAAEKFLKNAK